MIFKRQLRYTVLCTTSRLTNTTKHTLIHTHTYTLTHTHIHTYTLTHTHTHTHTYTLPIPSVEDVIILTFNMRGYVEKDIL